MLPGYATKPQRSPTMWCIRVYRELSARGSSISFKAVSLDLTKIRPWPDRQAQAERSAEEQL
jgi:hypothetical protein